MPDLSIGVAFIAYNAEKTLPRCLASIRPHVQQIVVGLDETTTDETERVALEAGADSVRPIKVKELHSCPHHGELLVPHFARARNQSFELLDKQLDFWMWLDCDDTLENAELLPRVLETIQNSPSVGAWLNYKYATIVSPTGQEATNTSFHRERILRRRDANGKEIGWRWQHRIHEVVAPECSGPPSWVMLDAPSVKHQHDGHQTLMSATRNQLCLEIDLEENPNDARAVFYLANGYFAKGDMPNAILWYERLAEIGKNPYELWQSWTYCSLAYERLGDLDNATKAAFCAIDIRPQHPEPWYRLASIALLSGKFDQVEWYTDLANGKAAIEQPPFFCFKNPMDYSFNHKMPLADALAAQGKVHRAREVLESAHAAFPDERVGQAIAHYRSLEDSEEKATAFSRTILDLPDELKADLWKKKNFSPEVKQFGRTRDLVMPAMLRLRDKNTQPRLIIHASSSYEEWSPETLGTTGIGGSETAVVEIAKKFQNDGWRVDVYNNAGRHEGEYDGVGYWLPERLRKGEKADLFVAWRSPTAAFQAEVAAPKAILWCHDLNYGPQATAAMQAWDRQEGSAVCGVSAWHARMLKDYYGLSRVDYLPNGIDLARFPLAQKEYTGERPRKEPFQVVYGSSPDRGLERLLRFWPHVLKQEPGTTLKIAYGWDNVDKLIAQGRQDLQEFKIRLLGLSKATPEIEKSIEWTGRLPQNKLAELYTTSAAWAYPTHFLEVSCISAMEAMAGGCVPVTTACGALPETIGAGGLLVPGQPDTKIWQDLWLRSLLGCLEGGTQTRWPLQVKGLLRVQELTWDIAYTKWKKVIEGLHVHEEEISEEAGV